mgnify:CR=1 FL=1
MVAMTTYTVTAERGTSTWLCFLQCVEHPGAVSQTKRLAEADELMREAISFVANVDESDIDITLDVRTDADAMRLLTDARAKRAESKRLAAEAAEQIAEAAGRLVRAGISLRDTGHLLGVSHQRVSQLTKTG